MRLTRILSAALALVMFLTAIPFTFAKGSEQTDPNVGDLVVDKTLDLEKDGTYTLNLSAYATGTPQYVTKYKGVPLDIVLVVDQSGSMNSKEHTTGKLKIELLREAVTNFVDSIQKDALRYGVNHQIAIVGFSNSYNKTGLAPNTNEPNMYRDTEMFIKGQEYNYADIKPADKDVPGRLQGLEGHPGRGRNNKGSKYSMYKQAYTAVNVGGQIESTLNTTISKLRSTGGTATHLGLDMALHILEENPLSSRPQPNERERVVVLFTDGVPHIGKDYELVADSAVEVAHKIKTEQKTPIYSVGIFEEQTDTAVKPGETLSPKQKYDLAMDFLPVVSSNYPNALGMGKEPKFSWFKPMKYRGEVDPNGNFALTSKNMADLAGIFKTISQDIITSTTTAALDEKAVMKDIITDKFTMPQNPIVEISTLGGTADVDKNITWDKAETKNPAGVTYKVTGNTVDVTGFNYSDKHIGPNHRGEKLIVRIKGLLPKDSAFRSYDFFTNEHGSGIYKDSAATETAADFPAPHTHLKKNVYVLDYAKKVNIDKNTLDFNLSTIRRIVENSEVNKDVNTLNLKYGYASKNSKDTDGISYTPTTMNWDGYDEFYVFGNKKDSKVVTAQGNNSPDMWNKVTIMPANNVYYEDDFVSETVKSNGVDIVVNGIQYDNKWQVVGDTDAPKNENTVVGQPISDTEVGENFFHGWEQSLADDKTYTDSTAHMTSSENNISKVSFSFTGTGVDIYSRTDSSTGTVAAMLKKDGKVIQGISVDNLSASGTFYQVPTVSFENLQHGTYTVDIMVTKGAAAEGRFTYYLDGIRVYNPIQHIENSDPKVAGTYAERELNAIFTEVRDYLLTAKSLEGGAIAEGAVYIDQMPNKTAGSATTATIGTYEKLGPKNEVYLAHGQAVAFKVTQSVMADLHHYYVGLKSLDGNGTTAKVTNAVPEFGQPTASKINIKSTADMYYEIEPNANGFIIIENTGSNILAVTKLRSTHSNVAHFSPMLTVTEEEVKNEVSAFSTLPVEEYKAAPDIVEVEKPEPQPEVKPEKPKNPIAAWFEKVFETIKGWFTK